MLAARSLIRILRRSGAVGGGAAARHLSTATPSPADAADEVERKFAPTPRTLVLLASLGTPRATTFVDRYFDTLDHLLTTRDMWLRRRDARVELKYPMAAQDDAAPAPLGGVDYYHETGDWALIARVADLARLRAPYPAPAVPPPDVERWLERSGVHLFGELRTHRRRYVLTLPVGGGGGPQQHRVHVDVDSVELTAVVPDGGTARDGRATAAAHGRPYAIGEVLAYLHEHRPAHYAALGASGLLAAKLG
ncbi:thiamine triphosphatase [Chrysochromulina tobinii]|uniref:Thiamine triphosphatase n=1 Tax=Chrysochromulina tobinii TaxID=1460289 RepID=A0A0M0J7C1_9EUKA|nr:thiamine triphosphatase [Chrysochromulina tobinii]|eukprot:KOO22128.1 thiamine triphosphatase [Chrysochromulina sp. CCMP291]